MSKRFVKLKKNWMLRGWIDELFTVVNCKNGSIKSLTKKQFYVAKSCNGIINFNSFAFLPIHLAILEKFIDEGMVEECSKDEPFELYQEYRYTNSPFVKSIEWSISGKCNLNCLHCFMESPSGKYGELSFQDISKIIEQFEQANVVSVSLTGGEPFIRKDILDIITLLTKKKIYINYILTNGLLVTNKHLETIRELDIRTAFQISFDGVGSHDYMRGTDGIEEDVINSIRQIRNAGFYVAISTSIDKKNVSHLNDTYELMKDLDIHNWRISSPEESGNWKTATTALSLEEEDILLRPILNRWIQDDKPFGLQLGAFYRSSESPDEIKSKTKYTLDSFDCTTCRNQSFLLPNGTLLPCGGYVDTTIEAKMPSLLKENLSDIWTKSYLQEIVNIKKRDVFAMNEECRSCDLFQDCGMGCRASALTATNDLMAKDPLSCMIWKSGYKKKYEEIVNGKSIKKPYLQG